MSSFSRVSGSVLFALFALMQYTHLDAESLASAPVVFKSGNWKIIRTIDQMTDKASCTGIYKNQYGIQLSDESLYIRARAPRGYRLRFDDEPQSGLILASDTERKIDSLILSDTNFRKALASKRLRYSSIGVLDRLEEGDLEMDGIQDAHAKIAAGCQSDVIIEDKEARQTQACSPEARSKLQKKLSEKEIEEICG